MVENETALIDQLVVSNIKLFVLYWFIVRLI